MAFGSKQTDWMFSANTVKVQGFEQGPGALGRKIIVNQKPTQSKPGNAAARKTPNKPKRG